MSKPVLTKLGLAASFAFYIGLVIIQANYRLFEGDIAGFWSIGRIANERGYSYIYNPLVIAEYQNKNNPLEIAPAALPSVFIIPFQFLALLPFDTAAWLWRFINLAALVMYCVFFAAKIHLPAHKKQVFLAILLSLPVYVNFAWGQVNLISMVAIGEFIRLRLDEKNWLSGAALGLLVIKPQMLIFVVPMLFFQKEWRSLVGFAVSAAIIVLASMTLTGVEGSLQLLDLWGKYSAGIPTNEPEHMVNWRMAGVQIGTFTNTYLGWGITAAGILMTGALSISLWKKQSQVPFYRTLNMFVSTLLISWHTHLHYMIILTPLLIGITAQDDSAENFIYAWSFSGATVYLVILLLTIFSALLPLPSGFGSTLLGVWGVASGLSLLAWSLKKIQKLEHTA